MRAGMDGTTGTGAQCRRRLLHCFFNHEYRHRRHVHDADAGFVKTISIMRIGIHDAAIMIRLLASVLPYSSWRLAHIA